MNKQQRDYEKAKQAKRRVEMKMEAREKSFLKGRGLMDSDTAKSFHLQIPFSFNGTAYFNWRFLTFHKMYISQIYVV